MIKKNNTRLIVATVSMLVAGSLVTSDAMAHKRHKRHSHKSHHATRTHHRSSGGYSSYNAAGSSEVNSKVDALEAQVRAMQDEVSSLRANGSGAGSADTAKVQELDSWMQETKSSGTAPGSKSKDNMVFFRGGYSHNNDSRGANMDGNGPDLLVGSQQNDKDAWYFGAGFDFSLSDNLFGLANGTEVLAELMFDYKELGQGFNLLTKNTTTVNQFVLAASPKIKFMKGSAFRPWLIPAGFELNIVSPPTGAVTVLNPGMQFGFGADYNVWNNIYVGADARYHLSMDNMDGVDTDGVTAGGYVGIGF